MAYANGDRPIESKRQRRNEAGFTLVEIAIVLVVIGLLLGGVLKAQELVSSSRVRKVADDITSQRAAVNLFVDRFQALPGDYTQATVNIPGVTAGSNGNGDGAIGGPGALPEEAFAWHHLAAAGFLGNCAQCMSTTAASAAAGPNQTNSPLNSFGGVSGLSSNGSALGTPGPQNQVDTGAIVPSGVLAEIDRKLDDGLPTSGAIRFSIYFAGPAGAAPAAAACTVAGAQVSWAQAVPSPNCGAALLLQ